MDGLLKTAKIIWLATFIEWMLWL